MSIKAEGFTYVNGVDVGFLLANTTQMLYL